MKKTPESVAELNSWPVRDSVIVTGLNIDARNRLLAKMQFL
jgi:hypothetical protein